MWHFVTAAPADEYSKEGSVQLSAHAPCGPCSLTQSFSIFLLLPMKTRCLRISQWEHAPHRDGSRLSPQHFFLPLQLPFLITSLPTEAQVCFYLMSSVVHKWLRTSLLADESPSSPHDPPMPQASRKATSPQILARFSSTSRLGLCESTFGRGITV